jgi:HAD superfamily hydrolase (TIGR01509 family)
MRYHEQAWHKFLSRHNITKLSEAGFMQKIAGKKNNEILAMIFGKNLDPKTEQSYAEEKEATYRKIYAPHISEIAGLSNMIEQLQGRNVIIAIATTSPKQNRELALQALSLKDKFEIIVGSEDVTHGKPHPEIYLATAKALGLKPSECLVFEDSPSGIESAKAAGMTVVGILSTHTPKELQMADYVADNYNKIRVF